MSWIPSRKTMFCKAFPSKKNKPVQTPVTETEHSRWSRIFSGSDFYYGLEPGPVARRAVRYHRPLKNGGRALDAGCGEGQDLAFLAQSGYDARGVDFTQTGVEKSQKLLRQRGLSAQIELGDLSTWRDDARFDLVLAVNSLQFLGAQAPAALENLKNHVAPRGVIGVSMFARENAADNALDGTIYRWTLEELLETFADWQPFEAAKLWQWGGGGPQPFVTLIAGNLRAL